MSFVEYYVSEGYRVRLVKTILVILAFPCLMFANDQSVFISTGSMGGNYIKVGAILQECMDIEGLYDFKSIQSKGSISNIENLKSRKAELALVQRDILLQNVYSSEDAIKNIQVLAPVYEEKFYLYSHDQKPISIDSFRRKLLAEDGLRIGTNSKSGSSYLLFKSIARYLNLPLENVTVVEGNYTRLIRKFKNIDIDYLVSFSLSFHELDTLECISQVYFEKDQADLVNSRFSNIHVSKFNESKKDQFTLGAWTFLIGLNSTVDFLPDTFSIKKTIQESTLFPEIKANILNSYEFFEKNPGAKNRYFNGLQKSLVLDRDLKSQEGEHFLIFLIITTLLFAILCMLFFNYGMLTESKIKRFFYRFKHMIIGIAIVAILYWISVEMMMQAETEFYVDMGIKSPLLNMTKSDLHFWVVINYLTQNDNGIFPLTSTGQLLLSFTGYIIFIGTLLIAIAEYMFREIQIKKMNGELPVKCTNHTILTGWNFYTSELLKDFETASREYNGKKEKVVLVVDNPEEVLATNNELRILNEESKIKLINGDIRKESVLKNCNITKASTVVLLAEDSTPAADEKTLLRALAISRYCRKIYNQQSSKNKEKSIITNRMTIQASEKETTNDLDNNGKSIQQDLAEEKIKEKEKVKTKKRRLKKTSLKDQILSSVTTYEQGSNIDSIYIIAEVNDLKYKEDLLNADANEIISPKSYGRNIITQSILNHGVSKIMDEILQFNDFNEFYTIDLVEEENKHLVGKTFDILLLELRQVGILLIGIKVVYHNSNAEQIIEEEKIKSLLKEDDLTREIIINPVTQVEKARPVDHDDELIVFCQSIAQLKKGINDLKKSSKSNSKSAKPKYLNYTENEKRRK